MTCIGKVKLNRIASGGKAITEWGTSGQPWAADRSLLFLDPFSQSTLGNSFHRRGNKTG